jgi:endonuclease YncB( thermonuclease family)
MWDFRARLTRPYDGDSFWVLCDTAFRQRYEPELRLYQVYAPELHQPGGPETRQFISDWFTGLNHNLQWPLYVQTIQTKTVEPNQKTTLDRYLAMVWRYGEHPAGVTLNESVVRFLDQHPEWPRGKGAAA